MHIGHKCTHINVHNMLYHGDTPMCHIWYAYVKDTSLLMLKVKVIQGSCMYMTHCPMVIHSCAKYGMNMTKVKKKAVAGTISFVKKPINLTLIDVKDHRLMMIDPCAKHDMPIFKANGNYGSDTKPCEQKYKFDL